MQEPDSVQFSPTTVLVYLLDPIGSRPVHSWKFDSKSSLSIGRGEDRDVLVSHPYVSRNHAELQLRAGQWFLLAYGRNGVVVRDEQITEYAIVDEVEFRLGTKGPILRFQKAPPENLSKETLSSDFDDDDDFVFQVDEDKVKREVEEITECDYFQSLLTKAQMLRQPRQPNDQA